MSVVADRFGAALRPLWALEDDMRFLNHGSYGATPRGLLAEQDRWRARMEAQPVRFFMTELPKAIRKAAIPLAAFVGTDPARLAFVENASAACNAVIRSLAFEPGDEVLTTDHVYNAVRQTLAYAAARTGARVIEAPVGMPIEGADRIVETYRAGLTDRTRLVVVDHVVSASAVIMPVARIAELCRERGVPLLVDGAHAPGMLDLDVDAIGADWYVGNCHKWLCAPKGAAFLAVAARPTLPIHPTVISHAYGQGFAVEFDKIGTRDASAWLTVPASIAFHECLGGPALRRRNRDLARFAARRIAADLGGGLPGAPDELFGSMATIRFPCGLAPNRDNAFAIRDRLWNEHRLEAAIMPLSGAFWVRISAAAYNELADYDGLAAALSDAVAGLERSAGADRAA